MEKCYEFLGWSKTDCVMYGNKDEIACWDVEGTLCNHEGLEMMVKKGKDKCKYCIYYSGHFGMKKAHQKNTPISKQA